MGNRKLVIIGLLIMSVTLSSETKEIEEQQDTCEAPKKPLNGDYASDVIRERYSTGDTIQYYCLRGHRLIGQAFRTCNGTAKHWEPDEPYCQPEYSGHLMRRMDVFEDKWNVVAAKDSFSRPISKIREHIMTCSNDTEAIDGVTSLECVTMQLSVRDGRSVFESKWVIKDFKRKVSAEGYYYSSPFYHTVPGYKFRLSGYIHTDTDIYIRLYLLPGEYDDQLTWPINTRYDLTVLTNDGSEVLYGSQLSSCFEKRPISAAKTSCYTLDSNWGEFWHKKKHILKDGSVAFKLYLFNA